MKNKIESTIGLIAVILSVVCTAMAVFDENYGKAIFWLLISITNSKMLSDIKEQNI